MSTSSSTGVGATLVGAFCFPHGAITLDPQTRDFGKVPAVQPDSREKCLLLHQAMMAQARSLVATQPDLIILTSPHGLNIEGSHLVLGNDKAEGSAERNGNWTNYTAAFDIDAKISRILRDELGNLKNPVELLSIGTPNDPLPLNWSEVVPWWFISEAAKEQSFTLPSVIYIGVPYTTNAGHEDKILERLKLGSDLLNLLVTDTRFAQRRVAVVVSSDLSHFHSQAPSSPTEYSPESMDFDGFIGKWAKLPYATSTREEIRAELIEKAGGLVDRIRSCGYGGLIVLHGMLDRALESGIHFEPFFLEYSAPTFYGMMVNHWLPKNCP